MTSLLCYPLSNIISASTQSTSLTTHRGGSVYTGGLGGFQEAKEHTETLRSCYSAHHSPGMHHKGPCAAQAMLSLEKQKVLLVFMNLSGMSLRLRPDESQRATVLRISKVFVGVRGAGAVISPSFKFKFQEVKDFFKESWVISERKNISFSNTQKVSDQLFRRLKCKLFELVTSRELSLSMHVHV